MKFESQFQLQQNLEAPSPGGAILPFLWTLMFLWVRGSERGIVTPINWNFGHHLDKSSLY